MILNEVAKKLKTCRSTLDSWINKFKLDDLIIREYTPVRGGSASNPIMLMKPTMHVKDVEYFIQQLKYRQQKYKERKKQVKNCRKHWKTLMRICYSHMCKCELCDNKDICNRPGNSDKTIATPNIKIKVIEAFAKYGAPIEEEEDE